MTYNKELVTIHCRTYWWNRRFPNYFYLSYIARSDTYAELDTVEYDGNNNKLTQAQILQIQAQLNNGNPTPSANGRIENNF